LLDRITT